MTYKDIYFISFHQNLNKTVSNALSIFAIYQKIKSDHYTKLFREGYTYPIRQYLTHSIFK